MFNRILIFVLLLCSVLGYAIYEAMMLDKKLSKNSGMTEVTIKEIPSDLNFSVSTSTDSITAFAKNNFIALEANTLVHFWATWCGPCEVEFPELVELINLLKDKNNFKFILIAVNDDKAKVKKFLSKFNIESSNVIYLDDKSSEYQKFGTCKLPESYLFNPSGMLIKKFSGQQSWSQNFIFDQLKDL